ncbi:hypothetical protein [Paraburkholderia sp. BCC1884]|uniref:hypothetical protein n=1 Tax=Paraburkholderia sp. BCC1884 TaxID=2562668 RepID=UPI001182956E|nr:hypothetical protein [Paraburkholderia sp. BCC1884]
MNIHPKLIMYIDGEAHVSGAGILILSASARHDSSIALALDARERAQKTIDALLSAARTGGFTQGDVLETMLSTDRESDRVVDLAIRAVDHIGGTAAFLAALERAGFDPEAT